MLSYAFYQRMSCSRAGSTRRCGSCTLCLHTPCAPRATDRGFNLAVEYIQEFRCCQSFLEVTQRACGHSSAQGDTVTISQLDLVITSIADGISQLDLVITSLADGSDDDAWRRHDIVDALKRENWA